MSSDLEFFISVIIIVIIVLFILWVFFGGGKYESESLEALNICIPQENIPSVSVEQCDVEEYTSNESVDCPEVNKKESVYVDIPTIIKKLPSYDIEYYRNYTLKDKNNIKRMEHRSANESRGEKICRSVLEKFFEKPFPSVRPDFLVNPETGKNLELDCYNEELGIALEYNGYQHNVWPNNYHKTEAEFIAQLRRDDMKRRVCEEAGIYLINVPHNIPHAKIPKFIEYYLPENVQHRRENGIDDETADKFWEEPINVFPKNGFV